MQQRDAKHVPQEKSLRSMDNSPSHRHLTHMLLLCIQFDLQILRSRRKKQTGQRPVRILVLLTNTKLYNQLTISIDVLGL